MNEKLTNRQSVCGCDASYRHHYWSNLLLLALAAGGKLIYETRFSKIEFNRYEVFSTAPNFVAHRYYTSEVLMAVVQSI